MGKYFSCGQYNKNYKYIIFGCFFNILVSFIFGLDLYDDFKELLLFPSKGQKKLYKHVRVHDIFRNLSVFIFSCVLYKIEVMSSKKDITYKRELKFSSVKSKNQIILIFNDSENEIGSISVLNFLFIITLYVCIEYLSDIFYQLGLKIFDFWMFELLVISYINAKMFKLKIYRHQKCAIFFNSFICLLFRLPYFILSFLLKEEKGEKDPKSLYELSKWYIVLELFSYIMIITIRAYSYTKIKWFMDLKYISSTKLLIYIGFIGTLVSSISCVIETYIKCSERINFCEVKDENNYTYIDNFISYYKDLPNIEDKTEITIEIFVILFGMICKFFASFYDILVIKFLTPIHIIFYSSIYYFFIKFIAIFYNRIKNNHFFNENKENDKKRFYISLLDLSCTIFAIFGFLIYLEIIELYFCKLNYNLRRCIEKRSMDDITQSIGYDDFNEEEEQSEKDNSKGLELE